MNNICRLLLAAHLSLCCMQAWSQEFEYYGEFSGSPSLAVVQNQTGRPSFRLLDDFTFTDPNGLEWVVPSAWIVDGATIPRAAWSLVGGPLSGRYLNASIIHDKYCDTRERTAHDTHRNFYYGMLAAGVEKKKAAGMYWAVRTFGPSWKLVHSNSRNPASVEKEGPGSGIILGVESPEISNEELESLIDNLDGNLDLESLDQYSDNLREQLGFEKLNQFSNFFGAQ